MKKNSTNKIKLGIFISLGMLILILGVYFIGERQQMFRSTFRLNGVFKNVSGLQIGNNVRLLGVNVGTIDNITIISDTLVNVEIMIDEDARQFIKKDAIASIGSEGLMGNKALIINPGTGGKKRIESGGLIATSMPIDIDSILSKVKTTIDYTAAITGDLASMTKNIESGNGTVGRLLMDPTTANNIDSTFISLKDSAVGLKLLMEKAKSSWLLWGF
ncbi:MAG: MlaD family protein [Melioribacteraceae bacterium]|nr:MlaD family protein [Melioribacteraceae bacterium]